MKPDLSTCSARLSDTWKGMFLCLQTPHNLQDGVTCNLVFSLVLPDKAIYVKSGLSICFSRLTNTWKGMALCRQTLHSLQDWAAYGISGPSTCSARSNNMHEAWSLWFCQTQHYMDSDTLESPDFTQSARLINLGKFWSCHLLCQINQHMEAWSLLLICQTEQHMESDVLVFQNSTQSSRLSTLHLCCQNMQHMWSLVSPLVLPDWATHWKGCSCVCKTEKPIAITLTILDTYVKPGLSTDSARLSNTWKGMFVLSPDSNQFARLSNLWQFWCFHLFCQNKRHMWSLVFSYALPEWAMKSARLSNLWQFLYIYLFCQTKQHMLSLVFSLFMPDWATHGEKLCC